MSSLQALRSRSGRRAAVTICVAIVASTMLIAARQSVVNGDDVALTATETDGAMTASSDAGNGGQSETQRATATKLPFRPPAAPVTSTKLPFRPPMVAQPGAPVDAVTVTPVEVPQRAPAQVPPAAIADADAVSPTPTKLPFRPPLAVATATKRPFVAPSGLGWPTPTATKVPFRPPMSAP